MPSIYLAAALLTRASQSLPAADAPAEAQLISGNQVMQLRITQNTRQEIKLDALRPNRGMNRLKLPVTRGFVDLD